MKRLVVFAGIVAILMLGVLAAFAMQTEEKKAAEKPTPQAMRPGMAVQPETMGPEMMQRRMGQMMDQQEMRERMQQRMARMTKMRALQMILAHQQALGLSDDQMKTIKQVRTDSEKEEISNHSALRKAEMEFDSLVAADELNMEAIEKKAKEIGVLEAEAKLIPIRSSNKVMNILTPEQKEKFKELSASMMREGMRGVPPVRPDMSTMPQPGQAVPPEVQGVEVK